MDWFVEAFLGRAGVEVSVARGNYGTDKQGKIEATLSADPLKGSAIGRMSAVELAS